MTSRIEIADFTNYRGGDDEDLDQVKRKRQREKKPVNKFSLLYMFPSSLLNEKGSGNKRKGFTTYDSLVCKKCSPARFFHARSALKLHILEDHDQVEKRSFASHSFPTVVSRNTRQKAKQKKVKNIECIDLSDSEEEDESDDEIEVVQENDTSVSMEGLSISNKRNSDKSPANESGYGSDIECVEENIPNKELQHVLQSISKKIESKNAATTSKPVEVTLEEEEPANTAVEVVLDDDVNAENGHIRNLMKDFQSPIRKRKEKFADSVSKRARVREEDDEMLLTEDLFPEVAISEMQEDEDDAPKIMIGDSFSLQESPVKIIHMDGDEEDDDILII